MPKVRFEKTADGQFKCPKCQHVSPSMAGITAHYRWTHARKKRAKKEPRATPAHRIAEAAESIRDRMASDGEVALDLAVQMALLPAMARATYEQCHAATTALLAGMASKS